MQRFGHLVFVALMLTCFGCAHSRSDSHVGLFTHLSVSQPRVARLDEAEIAAVVTNYGPTNATVNTWALGNTVLSVDVLDSHGQVLHPVPPSLPPPDLASYERVLSPGASLKFTYHLSYMVETPPGHYTVRMRHLPSEQIVLTIR
jgi:hypothetical protein